MRNYIKLKIAHVSWTAGGFFAHENWFAYSKDDELVEDIARVQALLSNLDPDPTVAVLDPLYFKMNLENLLFLLNSGDTDTLWFTQPPTQHIFQYTSGQLPATTPYAIKLRSMIKEKSPRKRGRHG